MPGTERAKRITEGDRQAALQLHLIDHSERRESKFVIISALLIQNQLLDATSDAKALEEGLQPSTVTAIQQLNILTCRQPESTVSWLSAPAFAPEPAGRGR